MLKFDHLNIPVRDASRSRDCYVDALGMTIEFEVPERRIIALQDSDGFTIFLHEVSSAVAANGCALWFQVADVDATFAEWSARGIAFSQPPRKSY